MKKLLWVTIPLLGISWLLGRYFNNSVPPEMEESWFFNFHIGLISLTMDLVSNSVDEVENNRVFSYLALSLNSTKISINTVQQNSLITIFLLSIEMFVTSLYNKILSSNVLCDHYKISLKKFIRL